MKKSLGIFLAVSMVLSFAYQAKAQEAFSSDKGQKMQALREQMKQLMQQMKQETEKMQQLRDQMRSVYEQMRQLNGGHQVPL